MDNDNKKKATIWLYPGTINRMDGWLTEDNCKSRSEFVEKALRFYINVIKIRELEISEMGSRVFSVTN